MRATDLAEQPVRWPDRRIVVAPMIVRSTEADPDAAPLKASEARMFGAAALGPLPPRVLVADEMVVLSVDPDAHFRGHHTRVPTAATVVAIALEFAGVFALPVPTLVVTPSCDDDRA